eukprot:7969668-Pyramimonas_sp.AAC.1
MMHLLDACARWSANGVLKDKIEIALRTRVGELWLNAGGPMGALAQTARQAWEAELWRTGRRRTASSS